MVPTVPQSNAMSDLQPRLIVTTKQLSLEEGRVVVAEVVCHIRVLGFAVINGSYSPSTCYSAILLYSAV